MNNDLKRVNSILDETIDAVSEGRDEVFKISESSRLELYHMESELAKTKNLIKHIITEVDKLEKKEKATRNLYMAMSKDNSMVSKREVETVFNEVNRVQSELSQNRMLEKKLITKRTSLEFHIRHAKEVLIRTETLTNRMGTALDYLSGDLLEEIKEAKISKTMGIEILRAQEEERKRISREIHDGPAQKIASFIMKVDYCEKVLETDKELAKKELAELKTDIRDGVRDIRRIIFDLMPMSLEDLGLIPTLSHYIEELNKKIETEIGFKYNKNDDVKVSNVLRLSAFRVVQEALNNVVKHSKATKAEVLINISNTNLAIVVQDNGIGINKENQDAEYNTKSGFGLYGIKERVRLLGGNYNLKSISDGVEGCILEVEFPL